MEKAYSRINWVNGSDSTDTPLNETNLNLMDAALNTIDNRVVEHDAEITELQGYETAAAQSAAEALASATAAAESESNAATSEANALTYKNNANTSATNAARSETNALSYKNSASTSATNAAKSETNALSYKNSASTSATNAASSEANALSYKNSASTSATNAATSERNALTYKNNASTSATNAAKSATNASNSATLSQSYAVGGTGTRTGEDTDNAKYYCEQAAHIVDLDASGVSFTPTTYLSSTNVQSAIEELDAESFRSRELCTETDANTIIKPGIYWCNPSVTANLPDTAWGMLEVVTTSKSNHTYPLTQKYTVVADLGNKYYLRTYRYVAPNYVWSDWQTYESANEMYKYNGIMGAKNLLSYPYYSGDSYTVSGVTFTVNNDDLSVTANGTATSTAIFFCRWRETHNLKAGTYRLNGCPSGGSRTSYYQWLGIQKGSSTVYGVYDTGDGVNAVITEEYEDYYLVVGCYVYAGQTVSNLTFYPMVRLSTDADDTYQPYAPTNRELYEMNNTLYKYNGVLGAKNLIPYPFYDTTKTVNGITFTDNGDGTVTADGTATANTAFYTHFYSQGAMGLKTDVAYRLNGITGGSTSTYQIFIASYSGTTQKEIFFVADNNIPVIFSQPFDGISVYCRVVSGATVSNLIFKPMLRLASDTDDTFQPYAETNYQLTHSKVDWKSNGILGAKNLITYPYEYANTVVKHQGITYTVDEDGIITVTGTKTEDGVSQYYMMLDGTGQNGYEFPLKKGEKYILSGCPSGGAYNKYRIRMIINYQVDGVTAQPVSEYGNGTEFTVNDEVQKVRIMIDVFGSTGTTYGTLTFKPMLRLASDTDETYRPYAKTNKELTDELDTINDTIGTDDISGIGTSVTNAISELNVGLNNKVNTSSTIAIAHGGTGATTAAGARNNLGLGNTSGALPVANGGTGSTTAAGARNNLDVPAKGDLNRYALLTGALFSGDVNVKGYVSVTDGTNYRGITLGVWNGIMALNVTAPIQSNYGPLELCAVNGANSVSLRGASVECRNYENTAGSTCWAGYYSTYSSRKYKENIKELADSEAKKILDVDIVSFDYKKDSGVAEEQNRFNKTGVIAEDIVDVCPEVVTYRENEIEGVDYSKLIPRLIKLVQLQEQRITELETRLNTQT